MSHDGARPAGEFLLYAAAEGQVRGSVYFEGETVWLTQKKSYKANHEVARLNGKDQQ